MGLFNRNLKIGEGQKFDTSQVSSEGISKEERAALEKQNRKLIDIFKAFDTDGDGSLSKLELAAAMDAFSKLDTEGGKDGKLSKKELEAGASQFNEYFKDLGVNIEGRDLKAFMKSVFKLTKNDTKESTQGVLDAFAAEQKRKLEAEQARQAELDRLQEEERTRAEEENRKRTEEEARQRAEQVRLQTPSNYTVQPNETLDGLLKRSLEAQGIEVNEENLKKAKEEFIKNNPNALHGPQGKEYLYMGDVVKIPGALEDKANADEIKNNYRTQQREKQAKADEARRLEEQKRAEQARLAEEARQAEQARQAQEAHKAKMTRLETALGDLSPASNYKINGVEINVWGKENLTKKNTELLEYIAQGNDPEFAAKALYAAVKGVGTNEVLMKAVLDAGQNKEYYTEVSKIMEEKYGISLYSAVQGDTWTQSPLDVSKNEFYKEYVWERWGGK